VTSGLRLRGLAATLWLNGYSRIGADEAMRRLGWGLVAALVFVVARFVLRRADAPQAETNATSSIGVTRTSDSPAHAETRAAEPASARPATPDDGRLQLDVRADTGEQIDDYDAKLVSLDGAGKWDWDDPQDAPEARQLAQGRYELRISAEGYSDHRGLVDLPAPGNRLSVVLTSTWTEITGVVVAPSPPSPSAELTAYGLTRPNGDPELDFLGEPHDGTTDPSGAFRVRVAHPGRYTVHFHDDALGSGSVEADAPAHDVRLEVKHRAGLRLHLEGLPPQPGELEGSFQPEGDDQWTVALETISEGHEVWGLPPGPATLEVSGETAKATTHMQLAEGQLTDVTLRFEAKRKIDGRVLDEAGKPIADARVIAGERRTETDDDGTFEFEGELEGPTLHIQHIGYSALEVPLGEGHLGDLVLHASERRHLTGRVHGASGERIERFEVRPMVHGDYPAAQSIESPSGNFSIDVPPETHELMITAKGFYTSFPKLIVGTDDLDVPLQATRGLEGQVLGADDAPAGGAPVSCDACTEEGTVTDASGRFRLPTERPFRKTAIVARAAGQSALAFTTGEPIVLHLGGKVRLHVKLPAIHGQLWLRGAEEEVRLPVAADGTVTAMVDRGVYEPFLELENPRAPPLLLLTGPTTFAPLVLDAPEVEVELRLQNPKLAEQFDAEP
jgi:hypothetical protein